MKTEEVEHASSLAPASHDFVRHDSVRLRSRRHPLRTRRLLESAILFACGVLLLRTVAIEPYHVPTGSMAPTLAGIHKATTCPRCGASVLVGRRDNGNGYAEACCPNCGAAKLDLDHVPECPGDHLLVDKNIFTFRRPHRWELAVFRFPNDPSKSYIKRVVGLPGERVHIRGGDLYIDGFLARKSLEQCKAMRIPVFDNSHAPPPPGWRPRWQADPVGGPVMVKGSSLRIDATTVAGEYQWLIYSHVPLADLEEKREPVVVDTYGYNGASTNRGEPVYDFLIECDVEVVRGAGWISLGLHDGQDTMLTELRVGQPPEGDYGSCLSQLRGDKPAEIRTVPTYFLDTGRTYHLDFAFVDRRVSVAIDGQCPLTPIDLPPATKRPKNGVERPARLGAYGVEMVVRNFRLFRDIHYTQVGKYGTSNGVRMLAGHYFVLGDNSPNSDDSRSWGAVHENHFVGKPLLIHMPTRIVERGSSGKSWRIPDWSRIRWLN